MPARQPLIVVVGSLNMDLVLRCHQLPQPGETVTATESRTIPGGKGANQAVAAARLGARVAMIGRVGDDPFGRTLRHTLEREGVDVASVQSTADTPSGMALITVENSSQNTIVVDPGANARLTPADGHAAQHTIAAADVLLLQLEVPAPANIAALQIARRHGVPVQLNPAPTPASCSLPPELWSADWLCPNETEAATLTGLPANSPSIAAAAAHRLAQRGAGKVLVTLGQHGLLLVTQNQCHHAGAFSIQSADATAAGDACVAAWAVAIAEGRSLPDCLRFAAAAGAITVSRPGASTSLPVRSDVEGLMEAQPAAARIQDITD
ncbi:MAG: ribokinase [Planctomycetota bacterium]